MKLELPETASTRTRSMHRVGVICGIAAGAWLGTAEAPTKLVSAGLTPFAVSLCMVAGVFTARWTIPSLLKGTDYVFADLAEKKHLIVWGILAGALWAVANTLTVFAIRDVGLAIAFPLWNTNCLVGIFWGWLLFRELHGAPAKNYLKVLGGTVAILVAAVLLAMGSVRAAGMAHTHALQGVLAAMGASLMWGTMYVPYRKAYLSGMNPLSFVTVFTIGELGTMALLAVGLRGGVHPLFAELRMARSQIFWLFLGGFCWVIGDLFQQYATKYIGIGRAIPLSNTNQLWGLAWGALVFGELAGTGHELQFVVIAASVVMLFGALAIGTAAAGTNEIASRNQAIARECKRYGLDYVSAIAAQSGMEELSSSAKSRRWWDYGIAMFALSIFVWLAQGVRRASIPVNSFWIAVLLVLSILMFLMGGWWLWKKANFS